MYININVLKSLKTMTFIYLCLCGDVHVLMSEGGLQGLILFPPVASKNQLGYQGLHLLTYLSGPL